jgi:hypothetical protein
LNLRVSPGSDPQASQRASQNSGVPADLWLVIDYWARLSEPLKAAVLAIVNTTMSKEGQ